MSTEQAPYSGSQLHVESWIEYRKYENQATGTVQAHEVAHFEIYNNPYAEVQWVKEYATDRKEFRDSAIKNARQFAASGKPAEAVISSRMALEIPWRGRRFMNRQDVVVSAMGMEDGVCEPELERLSKMMEEAWGSQSKMTPPMAETLARGFRMDRAMEEAFDTPYQIQMELEEIATQSREAIKGREVEAWAEAVNFFGDKGELFAAGVGALELGAAHEQQEQTEKAIQTYRVASELLIRHIKVAAHRENPRRHTAEANELTNHLVSALSSVVRLYIVKGSVKGEDKETVKAAVYMLDDLGVPYTTLQKGYELLATNSRFRERRRYKKEVARIAGEIAATNFLEIKGLG